MLYSVKTKVVDATMGVNAAVSLPFRYVPSKLNAVQNSFINQVDVFRKKIAMVTQCSLIFQFPFHAFLYTQQKKFVDTYKSSIFTWMLHIWQIKAYYVKQVNVFFILIPNLRNWLITNRVLMIWMETGLFSKVANEVIQLYRTSDRWADLYVDEW